MRISDDSLSAGPHLSEVTAVQPYRSAVRDVLEHGVLVPGVSDITSVGSQFGTQRRAFRELLGYTIRFNSRGISFTFPHERRPDLHFACANLLWMLGGADSVDHIAHYNARGRAFSDDGLVLRGAGGPRLRGGADPLSQVIAMLRDDPSTRRATLAHYYNEDLVPSRDVPCAIGYQYWIRHDGLVAQSIMRSQSAVMLLPFDMFFASALHNLVALEVGLPATEHIYTCGSLHIYEDELPLAERTLRGSIVDVPFLPMSRGLDALGSVLQFESCLRAAASQGRRQIVRELVAELSEPFDFWDQVKIIVGHHAVTVLGLDPEGEKLRTLLGAPIAAALANLH